MTVEERTEVIDTFISIGEKFLKGSKHFHLEPILARDIIQAIKELEEENAELKTKLKENEVFIENIVKASADNPNEFFELRKENEELKAMFDFVCKQRFGYAWNMNKDVYIADIKKALKGEKTQWV